jgi:RNA polymerase sigma-70 factor (ECF subfamily)
VESRLDPKLRRRVDPADIVQEAHLEAVRRLGHYLERSPMPFRLWLRQIAYDHLLKARRHHLGTARRAVEREISITEHSSLVLLEQLLAREPTPSQHLNRKELAQRLRDALTQLPEIDREILNLRVMEGLSYDEVSYLLDIQPATARKRQGRALLRLHRILFDEGLSESSL